MDNEVIEIVRNHYFLNKKKLIKKMYRRTQNPWDSEDIVQEAYERAIRYIRSCDPDRLDQWINTILNNVFKDFKSAERGRSLPEFDNEESSSMGCPHYSTRVMKEIYELIDTKSVTQMEVLNLYFRQDYRAIDISRITSHSYTSCHKIISRFREELQEIYK